MNWLGGGFLKNAVMQIIQRLQINFFESNAPLNIDTVIWSSINGTIQIRHFSDPPYKEWRRIIFINFVGLPKNFNFITFHLHPLQSYVHML